MSTCNATVTWFAEPGHTRVDDRCVLENGHMEYDHLPAGKAAQQVEIRIWNGAIDAMSAQVIGNLHDRLKMTEAFDHDTLVHVIHTLADELRR